MIVMVLVHLATLLAYGAPDGTSIVRLDAYPASVSLDGPTERQHLVVRGVDATGLTRDLTAEAQLSIADASIARNDGAVLVPLADGQTTIAITAAGQTVTIPLRVRGAAAKAPAISFRLDVLPVLARSGCNTGACHGSARGQDGFHLSLFGFDPASDHAALTRELPGRRINLANPEQSLLLQKAIGAVPHTGGKRLSPGDDRYQTVVQWLREGAANDTPGVASVVGIEVFPQDIALTAGSTQRLGVLARYSDGSDRDVTQLAMLITSNEYAAKLTEDGVVSAGKPGEAQVLARFGPIAVGTSVIVVPADAAVPAPESSPGNYIDTAVNEKLLKMRVAPSEICTDEQFLRRATLDLTGLPPTIDEYEKFMADTDSTKREKLVDGLMSRKEFAEIWVMKWAERLGIRSNNDVSPKATLLYATWLQQRFGEGASIDKVVRELVASEGGTFDTPATNFYQLERDTLKLSENVTQAFLGTRMQCAQCHNHPFDRWTMDDYYGFAAFFAQVGRKPGEDPRETIVFNSGSGDTKHPVGGRAVAPKFLGGPEPDTKGKDRRAVLAEWLTSGENRMFARNVSNFVWAHFFSRGIVEPVDDVRASNPPANEALLEALSKHLIDYKYDTRPLVRDICTSRAYQRSTSVNESNAHDDRNFSRAHVRRIRAEFLLDSISLITASKNKFNGLPLGARAVQIADGSTSNYFLTTFGRAKRDTVCTCEVIMEPSLSQALNLLNGDTVQGKIKSGGRIKSELDAGRTPDQILERLYIACLCRRPTTEEKQSLLAAVSQAPDPKTGLEDLFWSLLNSREFLFNH